MWGLGPKAKIELSFYEQSNCLAELVNLVVSRLSGVVVPILLNMQEVPSSNLTTSATHLPV